MIRKDDFVGLRIKRCIGYECPFEKWQKFSLKKCIKGKVKRKTNSYRLKSRNGGVMEHQI